MITTRSWTWVSMREYHTDVSYVERILKQDKSDKSKDNHSILEEKSNSMAPERRTTPNGHHWLWNESNERILLHVPNQFTGYIKSLTNYMI